MELRRVVVTGMGAVTPLGCGVETTWSNILASKSGAKRIDDFQVDDITCQIAHRIPLGKAADGAYDPEEWMDVKELRKVDPFIAMAMAAASQAIADAGVEPKTDEEAFRTGTLIGSGIGGIGGIYDASITLFEKGPRRISPFFIPGRIINMASGYVSIRYGLKGPNHSVVTACSTGAHAVGDSWRIIAMGDADVMVAGGAESPVNRISMAGFAACRALSTGFNDRPTEASRPYDKDRDGFVMGEGAAILVLEEYERAKARGAKIYAEVVGYGLSGDAYHVTAPHPQGSGAFRSMQMAIKKSGLALADIDYINAHGTSTPLGDELELNAVRRLFGSNIDTLSMSSTKSAIGHLLGGAGAVESIFCILALRDQIVPPTLNLDNPSEGTAGVDLVPHKAKQREVRAVLNNSFGFGGTNASLVMKSVD